MLKIKLARFGKKHQPHYRIVVNEAKDKRDGRYVVAIGHYAPTQQPKVLQLDLTEYDAWLKKGAQPTDTVASLAERVRAGKPFEIKKTLSRKAKAKLQAEKDAAANPAPKVEEAKPVEAVAETETTTPETPAGEPAQA